jgi:phage shock protein PspC (stress-responsive transcriptional regulator)
MRPMGMGRFEMDAQLHKADALLMGVCAAFARWADVDPLLVRINASLISLFLLPIAVPAYLSAGLILKSRAIRTVRDVSRGRPYSRMTPRRGSRVPSVSAVSGAPAASSAWRRPLGSALSCACSNGRNAAKQA